MSTLVVLGGGRALPALLKVYWLRPQRLVTVLPPQARNAIAERAPALFPGLCVEEGPRLRVSAPDEAVQALRELLVGPVQVSLTGTPLPLAVAALEVCRERALPAWYLDTAEGRVMDLAQPGSSRHVNFRVQVRDYLQACGLQVREAAVPETPWSWAASRHLAHAGPEGERMLRSLRVSFSKQQMPPLNPLLLELFDGDPGGLASTPEAQRVLQGGWLESWAERAARETAVFTDTLKGVVVEERGARRELDLVALRGASLLVASCKSGLNPKRAWLDELVAVARALGQEYCSRVMIHSAWKLPQAYLEQAHHLGVVAVTGEQLPRLGEVLAAEMLTPRYGRR